MPDRAYDVRYSLQSSQVGVHVTPVLQRWRMSIGEVKQLSQGQRVSGRGGILILTMVSFQSPGS